MVAKAPSQELEFSTQLGGEVGGGAGAEGSVDKRVSDDPFLSGGGVVADAVLNAQRPLWPIAPNSRPKPKTSGVVSCLIRELSSPPWRKCYRRCHFCSCLCRACYRTRRLSPAEFR